MSYRDIPEYPTEPPEVKIPHDVLVIDFETVRCEHCGEDIKLDDEVICFDKVGREGYVHAKCVNKMLRERDIEGLLDLFKVQYTSDFASWYAN